MSNAKVAAGCFGVFTLLSCLGAGAGGGLFLWMRTSPPEFTTMPVVSTPNVPLPWIAPPSPPPSVVPLPELIAAPTPPPEPTPAPIEPVAVPEPARIAPPSTPRATEPQATPTRRGTTMTTARTGQLSADDF